MESPCIGGVNMRFWRSVRSEMTYRVVSADISAFLDSLGKQGIVLRKVIPEDELTILLTVSRTNGKKLEKIGDKKGIDIKIVERNGLFWDAAALWKRPVLLWGLIFLLALTLFLPTRVLFVRVEGNEILPTRQILAAAEDCGIRFGANRRRVRSEKVKNALLGQLPELKWAGVNTAGCVATISVRERPVPERTETGEGVSSIVANRDGYVLSCTAQSGSLQCVPGQAVREGQVLISGYTDCGLLIRATRAKGEIFALTRHKCRAVTPSDLLRRQVMVEERKKISLILGKKRINFYNGSGISHTTCGRMYAEYYIYLPGGFRLPIALWVETRTDWHVAPSECPAEDARERLSGFLKEYVQSLMICGEIRDVSERFSSTDELYRLEGDFLCREMIGRSRQEGKVTVNGKSG